MSVKATIACTLLAVSIWLLPVSEHLVPSSHAGEQGTFTGTWVANGSKEVLSLGENRETSLFKLSGHVSLKDKIGKEKDFWANCIGLADDETGSDIRCVWRSMDGQEIYIVLEGRRMEEASRVTGNLVAGTGSWKGITGTLQFTWSTMLLQQVNEEVDIGGFSKNISGSYQIP